VIDVPISLVTENEPRLGFASQLDGRPELVGMSADEIGQSRVDRVGMNVY
jgi:hypothetical protein